MATVALSPLFNGAQLLLASGAPNNGGFINTYLAGTSTPTVTYADSAGTIPNATSIQLDAAGRPPTEIWLVVGVAVKFIVTDSTGGDSRTFDNIVGIISNSGTGIGDLTTTGNTILGDAQTDTLNVGNGDIVKTSAGNTGIGGNPTVKLDVYGNAISVGVTGSGTGGNIRMRADSGTARWLVGILGSPGVTSFSIYDLVAGAERIGIDSTGLIGYGVTPTAAQGLLQLAGSASGGIKLGNTNNTYGNALDWYEEGTFTPVMTGIGSPTYTTQTGEFQRIGNKVKFRLTMVWTAGNNAASIASITGMPYASTAAIHPVTVMANLNQATLSWTGALVGYLNGSTTILIGAQTTLATQTSIINPNAGTKELYIAGEYFV